MNNINLNPNYVSGFVDGEGCFHVSIVDRPELKAGKSVRVVFQISLHKKDKALLDLIKKNTTKETKEGLEEIRAIKSGMNFQRS